MSLISVSFGAGRTPESIHPVWTKEGKPSPNLEPLAGFIITPAQAHEKVWEARKLSLKHNWHIYADDQYYYVHDAFLGGKGRRAYKYGVKVDGKTGEIKN